ncbi:helix-turn-helix domain-containing protein [Zunongwangia sp. F363]|uniref:Helix-turn-helix domain-containing protein n=1 Tax=Autumnicola tepida TaxID=3075595 RepID=A0ABU3CBK6_9FLAO|nr:helix-turn-helix domain-containing protein [Zunongwangia sp. F363]MDT0643721.1 helix-turn-helix domain-containing protein [Zunongwangia sp. F363]
MKIKEIREKAGLSQTAFGEELGVTSQAVAKWEGGANVPVSIQKLIRYVFWDYLPSNERFEIKPVDAAQQVNLDHMEEVMTLKEENKKLLQRINELKEDKAELRSDKEMLQQYIKTLSGRDKDNRSKTA